MKSGLIDKELEDDFFDELNLLRVALGNAGCEVTHQTRNIVQVATWYVNQTAANARTKIEEAPPKNERVSDILVLAAAMIVGSGTTAEVVAKKAKLLQELLSE